MLDLSKTKKNAICAILTNIAANIHVRFSSNNLNTQFIEFMLFIHLLLFFVLKYLTSIWACLCLC